MESRLISKVSPISFALDAKGFLLLVPVGFLLDAKGFILLVPEGLSMRQGFQI
jgi:hypothetical protein